MFINLVTKSVGCNCITNMSSFIIQEWIMGEIANGIKCNITKGTKKW